MILSIKEGVKIEKYNILLIIKFYSYQISYRHLNVRYSAHPPAIFTIAKIQKKKKSPKFPFTGNRFDQLCYK